MDLRFIVFSLLLPLGIANADADLIQQFGLFQPAGPPLMGDLIINLPGLQDNGVTFDAQLRVRTPAPLGLNHSPTNGIGVTGGDDNLINDGESIRFDLNISNVMGGSVSFDGFTELGLSDFQNDNSDAFTLSFDDQYSTFGDNFFEGLIYTGPIDISVNSPLAFSLIGNPSGDFPNTNFRADSISGRFSGASAVPEPSSLFVMGVLGPFVCFRIRRSPWRILARLSPKPPNVDGALLRRLRSLAILRAAVS